jgi:tRNA-dihydrouridine synthase B
MHKDCSAFINRETLSLAPMAGVTDSAFREICRLHGCGFFYSEMISAKALCYNDRRTRELLCVSEGEKGKLAVQIFGHEPQTMAKAAVLVEDMGIASAIDINMGCPAPKIVNNHDGSALMKNPKLAAEIIKETTNAVSLPVSVKMRTGWDDSSINAPLVAQLAQENGASFLCVHGRTREKMYAPPTDLETIKKVAECVDIPVIGNGDIETPRQALHMLEFTGCSAVMIGRGALGNPFIFEQTRHFLKTGELLLPPTLETRLKTAREHMLLLVKLKGEYIAMREARKHMAWYLKGLRGSSALRRMANEISSFDDIDLLIEHALSLTSKEESYGY